MSTFIPMVSSSPPPLDETPDDDDFGGFTSAPGLVAAKSDKFGDFAAFSAVINDTVNENNHFAPIPGADSSDGQVDDWMDNDPEFANLTDTTGQDTSSKCPESAADVEQADSAQGAHECTPSQGDLSHPTDTDSSSASASSTENKKPLNLELENCCPEDSAPDRMELSTDDEQNEPVESPLSEDCLMVKSNHECSGPQKPDSQDNTSQGSMTDSGLCSDISPVPKFEEYPDFAESKSINPEVQCESDAKSSSERTTGDSAIKEASPGRQSKDSDSGHGVEMSETSVRQAEVDSSSPSEDAENADISPNEETLVSGSTSDYQLQDSVIPEEDPESDESNSKPAEPEPLHFKSPSLSLDELEDLADEVDDSFGQFPPLHIAGSDEEAKNISGPESSESSLEAMSNVSEGSTGKAQSKEEQSKEVDNDEDESGDFDDFRSCDAEDSTLKKSEDAAADDDDFDDFKDSTTMGADGESWAAFGEDSTPTNEDKDGEGGWAEFQEPPLPPPEAVGDDDYDDDEFGDFGDASVPTAPSSSVDMAPPQMKLDRALFCCFPVKTVDEEKGEEASLAVDLLLECVSMRTLRKTQEVTESPKRGLPGHDNKSKSSVDISVWNNLKDLEKTSALAFQWAKSFNNERLLKSLRIDTRNILLGHKRQSVPIFASQLGMLEPSRGPAKKEEGSPLEAAPSVDTTVKPATTHAPATTPQDIPPAEFDWSRSGLTNPLDASSSAQLDLDFFVKNATASCCSHPLQSEVLQKEQEILQALEPGPAEQQHKALEPLENVLANMKFTPTAPPAVGKKDDDTALSTEAQDVMHVLRDFSFMQATVLMFPYKDFGE